MIETEQLRSSGWTTWEVVHQRLAGLTCAWADWQGMHLGEAPPVPDTGLTHLWAWSDSSLHRVRVDGAEAVMATLGEAKWDAPFNDEVSVRRYSSATWREPHIRADETFGVWEIVEVLNGSAMIFVRPAQG